MTDLEKTIERFKFRKQMVLDDKCQYYENIALQALQEKLEREQGCEYCDISSGDVGATINTEGDDFVIIYDGESKSFSLATDDRHFKTLGINYCPICGRKLKGENKI